MLASVRQKSGDEVVRNGYSAAEAERGIRVWPVYAWCTASQHFPNNHSRISSSGEPGWRITARHGIGDRVYDCDAGPVVLATALVVIQGRSAPACNIRGH